MTDQELDPTIAKLIEYAKEKKELSWDELSDLIPADVINSDKMDGILVLLEKSGIQILEEDTSDNEPDKPVKKSADGERKQLIYNEKDSNGDDPIRMYLREIGKEHLSTAEQEVLLSKKMENGENIIKNVIKNSGMIIPEFYQVAQKAFSRIDPHESGKQRKEINEEMAEKRRLRTCYSEVLKLVLPDMKQYIQLKKQLYEADQTKNIFEEDRKSVV